MKRVYLDEVKIDELSVKELYAKRAKEKKTINIDSPVVLCGDKDIDKIDQWTSFEVENRLHLADFNEKSVVLELGCGTGRISKYITEKVDTYVGIDYVKEFIDIINSREDIYIGEKTYFLNKSFEEIVEGKECPVKEKFNRFIISGGVFMYINDDILQGCINKLESLLDEKCKIYISEPVAIEERLTLNKFYSENIESEYSAIYRTREEYNKIFKNLYDKGFKLRISEEFFFEDIKQRKETKQWIFVLER